MGFSCNCSLPPCPHYINLITQTGAYNYYNLYVMQELAYYNEPIDLSFLGNWSPEGCPLIIILPYLRLMLKWDSKHHKWEYENYGWNSTSLYSSGSFSSVMISLFFLYFSLCRSVPLLPLHSAPSPTHDPPIFQYFVDRRRASCFLALLC